MKTTLTSAVVLCVSTALACGAAQYTLTDLGTLGGSTSTASAINANGEIVGLSLTANGESHSFVYDSAAGLQDLGSVFFPNAVNSITAFQMAGTANGHAALYLHGAWTDLGTLRSDKNSYATGINNAGTVIGDSSTSAITPPASVVHGFRYSGGTMTDLGTLPGGFYSEALGINNSGQIVGEGSNSDGGEDAILYTNGAWTDLGVPQGGEYSHASAINDAGITVGYAGTADGHTHAYYYSNGSWTDLGLPAGFTEAQANAINSSGQIVGYVSTGISQHAFVYTNGVISDLNSLIDPSNFTLVTATAINDSGSIVGSGTINGNTHAFLLTPVTPTATFVLHPADVNGDHDLSIDEIGPYITAYLHGTAWPTPAPPSQIDIGYVGRAITLYLQGEKYANDPTQSPPLLWVPAP